MRLGVNPIRNQEFKGLPDLVAVVITHLPNREGYHAARFPIIKACIKSIRKHAGRPLPLLVWDNGSDQPFRDWLETGLRPEYLVLAPNIGKPQARACVLKMLSPEAIFCFTDDDMLHYPGWLDAHLSLLQGFPNVGAVSGWPVRFSFEWGNGSTLLWAKENAKIEVGRFISDEEETDYAESVGMDAKTWLHQTAGKSDIRIQYNGLSAYAEAQHCQFAGYAGRLEEIAGRHYEPRHGELQFDRFIDEAGMLRLTTCQRYTRHMGNRIDPKLKRELEEFDLL